MKVSKNVPTYQVKVGKNKSLLREYVKDGIRTVFLNDSDEFQIQLHNPTNEEVGVSIKLNGKQITNNTYIVLRPGELTWLERYIDTKRRFKFSTYDVKDDNITKQLIERNGLIEVSFHYKYSMPPSSITWTYYPTTYGDSYNRYSNISCSSTSTNKAVSTESLTSLSYSLSQSSLSQNTKKTGIIEQGNYSSQNLDETYALFNCIPYHNEKIKILPSEYKPIRQNDIQKMYCPECGRKVKSKYKYCPYCGEKL